MRIMSIVSVNQNCSENLKHTKNIKQSQNQKVSFGKFEDSTLELFKDIHLQGNILSYKEKIRDGLIKKYNYIANHELAVGFDKDTKQLFIRSPFNHKKLEYSEKNIDSYDKVERSLFNGELKSDLEHYEERITKIKEHFLNKPKELALRNKIDDLRDKIKEISREIGESMCSGKAIDSNKITELDKLKAELKSCDETYSEHLKVLEDKEKIFPNIEL